MTEILLTIIKTIGLIVLCVIGILLILLLMVLFIPIRYRIKGTYETKPDAEIKIAWLLHFLTFTVSYHEKMQWKLKILGIPLMKSESQKKHSKQPRTSKKHSPKENHRKENPKDSKKKEAAKEMEKSPFDDSIPCEESSPKYRFNMEDRDTQQDNSEKTGIIKKIQIKFWNIVDAVKKFIQKIRSFVFSLQNTKEKAEQYWNILSKDYTKETFKICKIRILKLLKAVFLKKGSVVVQFGLEDPASTANILAVYGMLYPLIGNTVYLYPDFEKKVLQAFFWGKGRIYTGSMLYHVLRIVADKNFRRFLNQIKKEIANE